MNGGVKIGLWLDVSEDCPMRFSVSGSNVTHLVLGSTEFELSFDAEALRRMIELGAEAVAEMDQRYAREEAERDEAISSTSSR